MPPDFCASAGSATPANPANTATAMPVAVRRPMSSSLRAAACPAPATVALCANGRPHQAFGAVAGTPAGALCSPRTIVSVPGSRTWPNDFVARTRGCRGRSLARARPRRRRAGPAAALSRAPRRLRPRLRPRRTPGARARARRLRLLPAGAVLEPHLLRRRRRAAPRPAMQPARPALCLRAARAVAAIRARLAAGLQQSRPRLRAPPRGPAHARHHAERAAGVPRVPQARHLLRASASTATSISRAGCYEKVKIPAALRRPHRPAHDGQPRPS